MVEHTSLSFPSASLELLLAAVDTLVRRACAQHRSRAGTRAGHQAHHRRRADPGGRLPHRAAGQDPPGLRQHLPPVHLGQHRRPAGTPTGPGAASGTFQRRNPACRGPRWPACPANPGRPPGKGPPAARMLPGVLRLGRGVRGTPPEFHKEDTPRSRELIKLAQSAGARRW